jgi:hypothetical protein
VNDAVLLSERPGTWRGRRWWTVLNPDVIVRLLT